MGTWFRHLRMVLVGLLMISLTVPLLGQAPAPGSASEFYLKYRKAFDSAKKVDDVLPYWAEARRKDVASTPAAERAEMFEMMKMLNVLTDLKIVKEVATANGATLTVQAVDADKANTTGTIQLLKEGGAWKVGKESWKSR